MAFVKCLARVARTAPTTTEGLASKQVSSTFCKVRADLLDFSYGATGSAIIQASLREMFPESILSEEAKRIPAFEYVERVLLPEAAGRLIHDDQRGVQSLESCWETLRDSYSFGHYLFPEPLDDEVSNVVLEELREAVSKLPKASVLDRLCEAAELLIAVKRDSCCSCFAAKTATSGVGCVGPVSHVEDHVSVVDVSSEASRLSLRTLPAHFSSLHLTYLQLARTGWSRQSLHWVFRLLTSSRKTAGMARFSVKDSLSQSALLCSFRCLSSNAAY